MNLEGRLKISLTRSASVVSGVSIESSRPLRTPEIFCGKPVAQMLDTLPLLYSVCGTAQAAAAVTASERALGKQAGARLVLAREMLVWMETAKEHLWRILLDWPMLLDRTPDSDGVAQMLGLVKQFRNGLITEGDPFKLEAVTIADNLTAVESVIHELETLLSVRLFNCSLSGWLQRETLAELKEWIDRSPTSTGAAVECVSRSGWAELGAVEDEALPNLDDAFYEQRLAVDGETFIATPDLDGQPRETSAYTREMDTPLLAAVRAEFGNGLLARFVARLQELAGIPTRLYQAVQQLRNMDALADVQPELLTAPGIGLAQVEAARGRLVHRVELVNDQVQRYQILAPTEWNFHPQGVLAKGLMQLHGSSEEELKQKAMFLINAVDPCVGYDLVVRNQ